MIQPPPDVFTRAADLARLRRAERREVPTFVRTLVWTAAGGTALCVHVSLYLLLSRQAALPPPPPVEMPTAVMITLAPMAVTAKSEVDNTMNGPPADAAEQAEAKPVAETPPPPMPEPVVDVPPPPPNLKPQAALPPKPPEKTIDEIQRRQLQKERLKQEQLQKKYEAERKAKRLEHLRRAASRAGGGPRSDRQTADVTAAAAAGAAVSDASRASWLNEVRAKIVRAKRFPADAHGQTGVSVVSLTFGVNGSVSGVRLVGSSGNAALDAEAVAVMSRAAPYPPPPGNKTTTLAIPLNFRR